MKYYNIELWLFPAQELYKYLKDHNFTFETSEAENLTHFEILANPNQAQAINNFLDTLNF
jgi:hypothetical protein